MLEIKRFCDICGDKIGRKKIYRRINLKLGKIFPEKYIGLYKWNDILQENNIDCCKKCKDTVEVKLLIKNLSKPKKNYNDDMEKLEKEYDELSDKLIEHFVKENKL